MCVDRLVMWCWMALGQTGSCGTRLCVVSLGHVVTECV